MKTKTIFCYVLIVSIIFFTISCDCLQSARGIIIDSYSGIPIDSVKFYRYFKNDTTEYADKYLYSNKGKFHYAKWAED
jgi:hypothetical protein